MNEHDGIAVRGPDRELVRKVSAKLIELVANIPLSGEHAAATTRTRARALLRKSALKSAAISGSLALPPGPLGLMTILPDLFAIWRIQAQLVADIAAVCGKTGLSNDRNDFVLSLQACRRAGRPRSDCSSRRTGIEGASRWVPIAGALGVAGYAYYDTSAVGQTAMDLFSKDLDGDAGSQLPEGAPKS